MSKTSKRILDLIDNLPLKENLRILEIGCGPGIAAREIANRFDSIFVLAIDQAKKSSAKEIAAGTLQFQQITVENFKLNPNEELFDFAFAIRVGALDGRHPELEKQAKQNIKPALKQKGKLYIDRGNKLIELSLET